MVNVKDVKLGKNMRKSFAKINEVLEMPNLIEVQKNSYQWFIDEGLKEVFSEASTITDYNGNLELNFVGYRFDDEHKKIKCCQGHSFPWVEPELNYCEPPEFLYHGTTTKALEAIEESGAIKKMKRHAVHMQADIGKAWQSAERWNKTPVVLKIAASEMARDGYTFGVTENEVWCTEEVPVKYICERGYSK